jgi:ADP-ribosylglycohydrolase
MQLSRELYEQTVELIVSDDTQMTLHLVDALDGLTGREEIQEAVVAAWVGWFHDPDMRGWGQTTITAIRRLDEGLPWYKATVPDSQACGAVMRVAACAWLPEGVWQPAAAFQAATTHGGFPAIAAAVVATAVLRQALSGEPVGSLLEVAIQFTRDDDLIVKAASWLADHPSAGSVEKAEEMLRAGMGKLRIALERAFDAVEMFTISPWGQDPSSPAFGGEGWLAVDALACALLCVDMLPGEPVVALRRATVTGGDSDTIGAITGMFLGALYGDVWPKEWSARLEGRYRKNIEDRK